MQLPKLLTLALLFPALAQAAPYQVRTLGLPAYAQGFVVGLDNNGSAAGMASGNLDQPLQWFTSSGGTANLLATAGSATLTGMNDRGALVGEAYNPGSHALAVKIENGEMKPLGDFGYGSTANAINNAGVAVGNAVVGNYRHAAVFQDGTATDIGTLGGDYSSARDINDAGVVVGSAQTSTSGSRAFMYQNGVMSDLGASGGHYSVAQRVNARNDVLGFTMMEDYSTVPFLYANGVMTNLGARIPGWAADLNDSGKIVGSTDAGGFLYHDGKLTDLDALIDPALGWTVTQAYAINNSDEIAVQVCGSSGCDLAMLAPIPEPETYGMLLAGLGVLGYLRRRNTRAGAGIKPAA